MMDLLATRFPFIIVKLADSGLPAGTKIRIRRQHIIYIYAPRSDSLSDNRPEATNEISIIIINTTTLKLSYNLYYMIAICFVDYI